MADFATTTRRALLRVFPLSLLTAFGVGAVGVPLAARALSDAGGDDPYLANVAAQAVRPAPKYVPDKHADDAELLAIGREYDRRFRAKLARPELIDDDDSEFWSELDALIARAMGVPAHSFESLEVKLRIAFGELRDQLDDYGRDIWRGLVAHDASPQFRAYLAASN